MDQEFGKMSATQPDQPGQPGRSSTLSLNLSSNNPFRNRAVSPSVPSPSAPRSPFDDPPPRPVSRNPFLDPTAQPLLLPDIMASTTKSEPTAEELFDILTIDDKKPTPPPPGQQQRPRPPMGRPGPPRGDKPHGRGPGSQTHRPTRSQEEALRAKKPGMRPPPPNGQNRSPQRRSRRRNSDSSIQESDRPVNDEEKKIRDIRRREHERRNRDRARKDGPRPSRKLDVIDQLDASSIYGTGLFHHDGPFDALHPHRNRQGSRRAPMQAFPEGSLNNTLGGAGPLNARPDHSTFMGNASNEAYNDYGIPTSRSDHAKSSSASEIPVFDPKRRSSVVFGDESLGLGTSTFLEGTPAARTAIQRCEAETQQETLEMGLQRKKSLAQRIRNINRAPRDFQSSGRMTNPDTPNSANERNPFFELENGANNEQISVRKPSGARSPTSPRLSFGLERRATADASSPEVDGQKSGGGLLARVKSLKGPRKQRPEPPSVPSPPPGTAV